MANFSPACQCRILMARIHHCIVNTKCVEQRSYLFNISHNSPANLNWRWQEYICQFVHKLMHLKLFLSQESLTDLWKSRSQRSTPWEHASKCWEIFGLGFWAVAAQEWRDFSLFNLIVRSKNVPWIVCSQVSFVKLSRVKFDRLSVLQVYWYPEWCWTFSV